MLVGVSAFGWGRITRGILAYHHGLKARELGVFRELVAFGCWVPQRLLAGVLIGGVLSPRRDLVSYQRVLYCVVLAPRRIRSGKGQGFELYRRWCR